MISTTQLWCQEVPVIEHEFGVFGGVANYYGDLNNEFGYKGVGMSGSAFWRMNITSRYALRASFAGMHVNYYDSYSKREFNKERNLSFTSNIFDISTQFEINFLNFVKKVYYNEQGWNFSPYIFFGAGLFFFNPKAEYGGKTYNLQPLGTEGQTDTDHTGLKKYNLYNFSFNYGVGFKYHVKRNICLGFELTIHRTFTDYLDDVSGTYTQSINLPGADQGIAYILADRSNEVGNERIGKAGYQRGSNDGNDDFATMMVGVSWTFIKPFCPKNLNQ